VIDTQNLEDPTVRRLTLSCTALSAGLLSMLLTFPVLNGPQPAQGDDTVQAAPGLVPVEHSMHEFMEYVFQPTYLRLKPAIAAPPSGNPGWKAIKSDALILAEGGNLLLLRKSAKDPANWDAYSVAVRDTAGQLYKAARAKDFAASRKAYEQMLISCNRCHTQFAGGKHMLAP
jgi:hypothetical protein